MNPVDVFYVLSQLTFVVTLCLQCEERHWRGGTNVP
jgi:hypothetical protein